MTKQYKLALHIFRRDLRLQDNTALIEALRTAEHVIPCFIFDPRQIKQNDYKSDHCLAFMRQSLQELDETLKQKQSCLYYFYGIAEDVVAKLIESHAIDAVFINRDYTPFSLKRDHQIEKSCKKNAVAFHCMADALLNEPEQVFKADRNPYTVYTPYRNKAKENPVAAPQKNLFQNYYNKPLADTVTLSTLPANNFPAMAVKGGREEGLKLLQRIKLLKNYDELRNIPAEDGTTKLSAHNKFGTISAREFFHYVWREHGKNHTLINELYWRDFFTQIAFYYPAVFGESFHAKYDNIKWSNNEKAFRAWCEGQTGFPIVDAGMRELNTTGYMHNRVRMITASFLTKDLHIDWRWGEKYFAQLLVDYDPAVNNGNWQWAASTGCDAQPYFRIFNPWLQQKKFDPDCLYIKKYIHELAAIPPKTIHNLAENQTRLLTNYPDPIVNHSEASAKAKSMYKKVSS